VNKSARINESVIERSGVTSMDMASPKLELFKICGLKVATYTL
jgi:hypothetical protein